MAPDYAKKLLIEATDLLKDCQKALDEMPYERLSGGKYKDNYDLAQAINKFLNPNKNKQK